MRYYTPHGAVERTLADGRPLAEGEFVDLTQEEVDANVHLIKKGDLVAPMEVPPLSGDALQERARELDIEGRSTMTADQLRKAVKRAENEIADKENADA